MEEIKIVDNYMDEREFRNYIFTMFDKNNFYPITIDDVRLSDDDTKNNNDLLVTKDDITYSVQTYLNTKITEKQIEETLQDMDKEDVGYGIIVTNFYVSDTIREKARKEHIIILDRASFEDGIY